MYFCKALWGSLERKALYKCFFIIIIIIIIIIILYQAFSTSVYHSFCLKNTCHIIMYTFRLFTWYEQDNHNVFIWSVNYFSSVSYPISLLSLLISNNKRLDCGRCCRHANTGFESKSHFSWHISCQMFEKEMV